MAAAMNVIRAHNLIRRQNLRNQAWPGEFYPEDTTCRAGCRSCLPLSLLEESAPGVCCHLLGAGRSRRVPTSGLGGGPLLLLGQDTAIWHPLHRRLTPLFHANIISRLCSLPSRLLATHTGVSWSINKMGVIAFQLKFVWRVSLPSVSNSGIWHQSHIKILSNWQ